MKLEDQVCSLELSKRLKELGVKQESCFYWRTGRKNEFSDYTNKGNLVFPGFGRDVKKVDGRQFKDFVESSKEEYAFPIYSAFTVAELGELLP